LQRGRARGGEERLSNTERLLQVRVAALGERTVARQPALGEGFSHVELLVAFDRRQREGDGALGKDVARHLGDYSGDQLGRQPYHHARWSSSASSSRFMDAGTAWTRFINNSHQPSHRDPQSVV